ncbi:MAG: hypothetical protein JO138_21960 [Acidobacteriaceae bacterium]|nr:hypothetical protein [Acidobacteriaceae bacterium]
MTRQITNAVLTAGLSALLGSAALKAQDRAELATVPFAFHAQQTSFEAGKYRVEEGSTNGVFRIAEQSGRSVYLMAHPVGDANPNEPKLTFACYGGQCVLEKISMPGSNVAWGQSQSSIEKSLSHKLGAAAMISVPLKAR